MATSFYKVDGVQTATSSELVYMLKNVDELKPPLLASFRLIDDSSIRVKI